MSAVQLPSDARPYPDAPRYLVTPRGEVYSTLFGKVRGLRPWNTSKGYQCVNLGSAHRDYVHRLVLLTHRGPIPHGMETRHLDGDPLNNSVANLAIGTAAQNAADRIRHGTAAKKLDADKVRAIRACRGTGRAIAKRFRVSASLVSQIRARQVWRHVHDEPEQLSFEFAQPIIAQQKTTPAGKHNRRAPRESTTR